MHHVARYDAERSHIARIQRYVVRQRHFQRILLNIVDLELIVQVRARAVAGVAAQSHHIAVIQAVFAHTREDIIRGPVNDTHKAGNPLIAENRFNVTNHRYRTRNRRFETDEFAALFGELKQRIPMLCKQRLIRRHNILAGFKRSAHDIKRVVDTTHEFDDRIDGVVFENKIAVGRSRNLFQDFLFLRETTVDDRTDLDETLRAMDDLVRAGKVLYPACSNFAAWQVARALGVAALHRLAPLVALQPMYNLLKRQAEVELLPMAAALDVAVVPYSPTAGGLLTGKWGVAKRPDSGRMTSNAMYQTRYADPAYLAAADGLTAIAGELGVAPAALAVAWVAAHPAVTSVLLGARDVAQLDELLTATAIAMPPELRARIAALTPEPPPATDRNEERSAANYGAR